MPTDTTGRSRSDSHGQSANFWTTTVRFLKRPNRLPNGTIIAGVIVALVAFVFGWRSIDALRQQQVARIELDTLQRQYDSDTAEWGRNRTTFDNCLQTAADRIDTRNGLREVLFALTDLTTVFPGSASAEEYRQASAVKIDDKYPPLDLAVEQAKCTDPGPPPKKPPGVP